MPKYRPVRTSEMEQLQDVCASVAQFLTHARGTRNMGQKQIASIVGCKQANISRLETGFTTNLCILTVIRAADALGYKVKLTFEDKENGKHTDTI